MRNRNILLSSRIFNDTGDWFYYFVIVVIVYSLSNNAIILGILAASYTLPGILFSGLLAKVLTFINDKPAQVIFDSMRIVMLIGLVLTQNIIMILVLVFLEQILAIGSNLSFQRLTTDIISGKKNFLAFNRDIKIFSNASRLLVIPLYLILHQIIPDRLILGLDVIFTSLSLLSTLNITYPSSQQGVFKKTLSSNKARQHSVLLSIENSILLKRVVTFSTFTIIRAFVDAYGIMYINKTYVDVRIGYAMLVFLMSLADLVGGLVSKNFILATTKRHTRLMLWLSCILTILFTGTAIIHNPIFFIIAVALCRFTLILMELFVLYTIQDGDPSNVHLYIATQTAASDSVALTNAFIGGPIIKTIGLYKYMFILDIILMISVSILICKRLRKIQK